MFTFGIWVFRVFAFIGDKETGYLLEINNNFAGELIIMNYG